MAMVVICFGQLVNVSVGTSGQMLVMTGKPRINLINTGLFVVLTIILNFILIPKYDILGAGIANAVSFSILNAVRTVQIYRYVGIHPFSKGSLKPVFAGLVALGLSYMVKSGEMVNHEIFRVGLAASVFVIAYTSIIFLMRLSKEEKEMINLIKKKFVKKRN
jgi:O-antigen/teichoic acid export membrane protein